MIDHAKSFKGFEMLIGGEILYFIRISMAIIEFRRPFGFKGSCRRQSAARFDAFLGKPGADKPALSYVLDAGNSFECRCTVHRLRYECDRNFRNTVATSERTILKAAPVSGRPVPDSGREWVGLVKKVRLVRDR